MGIFILEYGDETVVIRADDNDHALKLYNDLGREMNERNRWIYFDQIEGGGRRQRRQWRQYQEILLGSVMISEVPIEGEPEIVFSRENSI